MFNQTKKSAINTSGLRILITCLIVLLLGISFVSKANAQVPHPADYPKTVDPWGIIIYEHPDFTGRWITFSMEAGTRHTLVSDLSGWEDKVTSIQVGSNVGVYLFAGRNFYAGSESDRKRYDQSVSRVQVDFTVGSLIVFPKAARGPIGVWLRDVRSPGYATAGSAPVNSREITFFPLPASETKTQAEWEFLGQFNLEKNANYVDFDSDYVEVTLYEARKFQGAWITFPGAGPHPRYFAANFGTYRWSDRAASLVVKWVGPPGSLGPKGLSWPDPGRVNAPRTFTPEYGVDLPGQDYKSFFVDGGPEQCEKACGADPNCKAYTWVKPGVQGAKAACWLKSTVPAAVSNPSCVSGWSGTQPPESQLPSGQGMASYTPDLSGKWQSSTSAIYIIRQTGNQIRWALKKGNEHGVGTLAFPQISASWSGDNGAGRARGKVIVDESGKAIRIEWDNGVVFLRQ